MIGNQLYIEFKSELLKIKDKEKLEKVYYEKLSKCLKSGQLEAFKLLLNSSIEFNIFIDAIKIPNRDGIISNLILNCIDKITTRYQTSALGEILDILRFCNQYGLLERKLNNSEQQLVNSFKKKNRLFLANLEDLFGRFSDSLIFYVYKVVPQIIYNYFITSSISIFEDQEALVYYIKYIFLDQYTIYGLSVRNLIPTDNLDNDRPINSLEKFFEVIEEKLIEKTNSNKHLIELDIIYNDQRYFYDRDEEVKQLIEKRHLVSPNNIVKNKSKILDQNNYNFYNLSMILLGGLGPQGLGFTYSTPRGEIIEICSDQKESEAIIIKYKEYLTRIFLIKLGEELSILGLDSKIKSRMINSLSDILNPQEFINYKKKRQLLAKIENVLKDLEEFQIDKQNEFKELLNKVAKAISIILRKIKLRDQFITRMDLVAKDKVKSEDIAKLTSLKGKSHYDVLRERFFFQHITDWFYEIYRSKEYNKIKKK
ncbi:MAG: hypothetical protein ACFFEY_09685 [Candidatus Thorarchaeota archaeon]